MSKSELLQIAIAQLKSSLPVEVNLAGLYTRNNVAHKWKVTYFTIVLRESICWRFTDLLEQSFNLGEMGFISGARIIARAVIETLATLIYLNNEIQSVLDKKISFYDLGKKLECILVGSRTNKDLPETINVLTIIQKAEKKHPGILKIYEELCETTHPSYISLTRGYTKSNHDVVTTKFGNFWNDSFGKTHQDILLFCIELFENEYNNIWDENFKALEEWLIKHNDLLVNEMKEKLDK